MAHDVFVSYSQKDKTVADAVVARLEQDGIRCWIAPRDIVPGTSWGDAIVDAIAGSRVMVLILSSDSMESRQVIREVERAVSVDVAVLPFRIEAVDPTGAMAYFLGTGHWLDALTPPLERHIDQLSRSVASLLSGAGAPATPAPPPAPSPPPPGAAGFWQRLPGWAPAAAIATAAALAVAIGIVAFSGGGNTSMGPTTTTTTEPVTTTEPTTSTTTEATTTTTEPASTTSDPTRYAYVYELTVGECFDDRGTPLIPIVPCSQPHDREVFAIFDFPEGPYPDSEDTSALCIAEFDTYVGITFADSVLALNKIVPSEDAWAEGERTIYCALYELDGSKLVGSARDTAR